MRLFAAMIALLAIAPQAIAETDGEAVVEIEEWTVPWPDTRPRDPSVAADGRIWFVGQAGHYVGVFDPEDESFQRFDLDDGTGPHTVIVTEAQEIWYAGNRASHLGRVDPESGEIHKVPTPEETAHDPHTMVEDGQGRIWFTAQWGNHVGRYDPESGEIDLVAVPTERARPYGIELDSDGNAWVVLVGTYKLARINAESFELTEIDLPREEARPRRIAVIDSGVWYVDYNEGYIGRYNPERRDFDEWRAPGESRSGPYALAADDRGRLWFVETMQDPNRLVGFDPDGGEFIAQVEIPSRGGAVRHMVFDPATRSIWFGTDTNNLGRAKLLDE